MNTTSKLNQIPGSRPTTEVVAKAQRRQFSAEYKRRVLHEADACDRGELGALLRREGLYSSHLAEWRRARDEGELAALEPQKRGPKSEAPNPLARRLAEVERENARLKAENTKLEIICEVQKKLSQLLGVTLPTAPPAGESSENS